MVKTIYIGNLAKATGAADVRNLLTPFGEVQDLEVRDREDRQGGFKVALAKMGAHDADRAIANLDGTRFAGRKLLVREKPAGEQPQRN